MLVRALSWQLLGTLGGALLWPLTKPTLTSYNYVDVACNQLKNSFRLKMGEVERENYAIRDVHVFYDFIYRALQTS